MSAKIFYLGLASQLKNIQEHLDTNTAFEFKRFDQIYSINNFHDADLVLIGPSVENPVKAVQQAVAKDKHISIIILVTSDHYNQVKQSIQFSLAVGKNTSCVVFKPDWNYSSIFHNGITRTKQKRSFNKFNRSADAILLQLNSHVVKLDNFGDVLEHAPVGALLVDSAFNIIGANGAARKMFKSLDDKIVRLETIFPAKHTEQLSTIKKLGQGKLVVEDYSGYYYDISCSVSSSHDGDKTLLLITDITERYEQDKRFTAILESLPQIAWAANEDGSINYYNRGWFDFTNKDAVEGMGEGWVAFIHPDDLNHLRLHWNDSVKERKVFQHAFRLRRFDGEFRWHLSKAVPILTKTKRATMWVGTATDIHDQVKLNEELERKVKDRTKLLEETNAELEQFAHISSHDLQEPLRKIQTFAQIISDGLTEDLKYNGSLKKYVDKIISTATRMSTLLKDLLHYSKINQQEPTMLVNLDTVIDEIKEDLEVIISSVKAELTVGSLPVLNARPLQIKQLFYNLINNSLKYRRPDNPPVIAITCKKVSPTDQQRLEHLVDKNYWQITVKDNGIGFEQRYAEQIFTVFQRLHTRSAYEGTGIGLAIAKKIVSNHGGEIFAISSVGHGSEFHIILPAGTVQEL